MGTGPRDICSSDVASDGLDSLMVYVTKLAASCSGVTIHRWTQALLFAKHSDDYGNLFIWLVL